MPLGSPKVATRSQTYLCTMGGSAFAVTCSEVPATMALSGFRRRFGHLSIEALSGSLERGALGPKGKVWGSAVLALQVACRVQGEFDGTVLRLVVTYEGDHPLWSGLNLAEVALKVGPSGVSGSAVARYALPSVRGEVALGWTHGRLVAHTTKAVTLPWLGSVVFQVTVDGLRFTFVAEAPALAGLTIPRARVHVTAGRVAVKRGRLRGHVAATVTDDTGALSGELDLEVLGISQVMGRARMALDLPGSRPTSAVLTVPPSGAATLTVPRLELATSEGAREVALSWSSDVGLRVAPWESEPLDHSEKR